MLKVVLSIIIWLGLWCIWTIWQDFFPFSSPPLNGRTQCLLKISVLNAQHQEVSTLSFLYLHRQCHPQWWLTEAFRHAWWKILNPTFVPPPCILHLIWNGNICQPTLLAFTTQFTCRFLTQLRATHRFLNLVEENLGTQSQSRSVQSKGSLQQLTRNPRKDRNCPLLRQLQCQWSRKKSLLARFQLPQKLFPMLSTLTTLTAMPHQQQLPFTTLKSTLAIVESPRPTPPFLRVLLHLRWHQIPKHQHLPPIESFSQIQWIHLVLHHSVPGPTQMIKSWRVWNRTQSPVLRGRRSVQDFIAIPRYANWDGASWNKRLGFSTKTVMTTHPSNQRRRTNKQYCPVNGKKDVSLHVGSLNRFSSRLSLFVFLPCGFFFSCFVFVSSSIPRLSSANMAHSSAYRRTVPERSRSRDDPMWHSHYSQQRGRPYDPRPEVPPAPRLRKVLAIVDLQSVRPLMTKTHDDVMDATTCDVTPSLSRVEERALFTYNVLLNTHRLESFTVYNLLYCISQHIWYTWDHYLPPSSMDIRWQDETGYTFALRNENRLVDLLHDFRPQWVEGQECGLFFPNDIRPFTSHLQPYIMRMSCHEALPNRNMLPWAGQKVPLHCRLGFCFLACVLVHVPLVLFPTFWLFFGTWLQLYHDQTWFPACRLHVSFVFYEHATSPLMEIS